MPFIGYVEIGSHLFRLPWFDSYIEKRIGLDSLKWPLLALNPYTEIKEMDLYVRWCISSIDKTFLHFVGRGEINATLVNLSILNQLMHFSGQLSNFMLFKYWFLKVCRKNAKCTNSLLRIVILLIEDSGWQATSVHFHFQGQRKISNDD